ncbi:RsmD family RNA methyltransferase [Telmatocola sphagniphila]|uniref:RsmD family RNA methyltransferase n=1 Tax=Telmatocola sphagniphila TaxID=1123043 RepID=A0A8E6B7A3_9BACT|nr:RsmD family RNA methyltransferase [Telmatocola sphagniphila]QVL32774.1 RsmD family RNA methyltransferase [Telmatocola sphagniphila]
MEAARVDIRIVAGDLRGRKVTAVVHDGLRPTPQMVREALFSILGNAVPDRTFYDVFAGTGVIGMEAISRGASKAVFLEKDAKLLDAIQKYLAKFGISDRTQTLRTDVYRYWERWIPVEKEPVNVFFSPPFPDLTEKMDEFSAMIRLVCDKIPVASVVIIQAEDGFTEDKLPFYAEWDRRKYGRNLLLFWVKEDAPAESATAGSDGAESQ